MKKLTLLTMACSMAILSFAAGGNITYVLNGGVTNPDGWKDKEDMYQGLYNSWNTFKGGGQTAWTSLAQLITDNGSAVNAVPKGIPTQAGSMALDFIQDATVKAKWQWLIDYMNATCTAQGIAATNLPSANASYLRYNLSAFFFNSVRTSWPASADYTIAGSIESFQSTWKHGFAGPATYDGTVEITLPIPYKEGESFLGWYNNAEFSGEKITAITAGTEGDITLYAKFGEYIATCKEVWEGAAGTTTKTQGVVTYVNGTTAYIQDASAGLEVTFATTPDIVKGDNITISGTVAAGGKLTGTVVIRKEIAALPAIQKLLLSTLVTDAANQYTHELVSFEGLKISAIDGNNLTLTDETNSIVLALDASAGFPIGTKLNLKAIALFNGSTHSLVGYATDVAASPVPRPDTYAYPVRTVGENTYTLTSNWLVSNVMDNLSANPVASAAQFVRGMVAKNGKMYFPDRGLHQLTIVDGATGERLPALVLDDNVYFQHQWKNIAGEDSVKSPAGTLRYNDIKLDAAGNILLGNCITSGAQPFQVWKVDETTGAGTLIIDEILNDNPDLSDQGAAPFIRIDAFSIYGDVESNGYILGANANSTRVYKWDIINGVAQAAYSIDINTGVEDAAGTGLVGLAPNSDAPQTYPFDENLFYIDYFRSLPTLIDMDGNWVDGFYQPSNDGALVPAATDDAGVAIETGGNGITEFEFGGDYYLIIAATDGAGTPGYAYRLFKYANANREFKDMISLWTFPKAGTGIASNGARAVVSSVDVSAEKAIIYIYSTDNGYGVYELKKGVQSAVEEVNNNAAVTVGVNGKTLNFGKEIAGVKVYNIAGQLVAQARNISSLDVSVSGVLVVKATTIMGETAIQKIVVK